MNKIRDPKDSHGPFIDGKMAFISEVYVQHVTIAMAANTAGHTWTLWPRSPIELKTPVITIACHCLA
jgi:hypothetical protein